MLSRKVQGSSPGIFKILFRPRLDRLTVPYKFRVLNNEFLANKYQPKKNFEKASENPILSTEIILPPSNLDVNMTREKFFGTYIQGFYYFMCNV